MTEIARALADKRLLGAGLGSLESWQTWLIALNAAFALPLTEQERPGAVPAASAIGWRERPGPGSGWHDRASARCFQLCPRLSRSGAGSGAGGCGAQAGGN